MDCGCMSGGGRMGCGCLDGSCNMRREERQANGGMLGKPDHVSHMPISYPNQQRIGAAGPPTAAYAYPYYTIRGPRDFFMNNPPTIGP